MAEINDLNVVDAGNTGRFPEGQSAPSLNNGARALEGLIARWHKDTDGSLTTGGTGTAYTLTPNRTIPAYYNGLEFRVSFHVISGTSPTINIGALGAKALVWPDGAAVKAGELLAGAMMSLVYDGTNFQVSTSRTSVAATGSPTGRLMSDRFGEIVNVKDFGATGDGSTNDASAFQAAIDATTDGDHVVILLPEPAVSYLINTALTTGTRKLLWLYSRGVSTTGTSAALPGSRAFTSFQGDSRHAFVGNFVFGDEETSGDTGELPVLFIKRDAGHTGGATGEKRALSVSNIVGASVTNFETAIVGVVSGSNNSSSSNLVGIHTEALKTAAGATKYWGANFVAKDQTGLASSSSGGTLVGTEITITADGDDNTVNPSRVGFDVVGRREGGAGTATFGIGLRVNTGANSLFREGIRITDQGGGDITTGLFINAAHSGGRAIKVKTTSGAGTIEFGSTVQSAAAVVSQIALFGNNGSGAEVAYVRLRSVSQTLTAGSEVGRFDIQIKIAGADTTVIQPDGANATNPVSLFVGGSLKRVTEGAIDSGGAGFKYLRVPN